MSALEGKSVLVTGAGSGIGRGVAEAVSREGGRVAALELSPDKADELRSALPDAVVVQGDATAMADNKQLVEEAVAAWGSVDAVICCVGLFDYFTSLIDMPEESFDEAFDQIFAVNVKSYLLTVKAALPHLLESEGNIVFTLSNAAFYPAGGGPLYTSSKHAVRGLVAQLAYELAPKIRVNGVAPGGTVTKLRGLDALGQGELELDTVPDIDKLMQGTNPLQVLPTPEDHAWAYVHLAVRERTRAVTGTIIHSDGGLGMRGLTKVAGLL